MLKSHSRTKSTARLGVATIGTVVISRVLFGLPSRASPDDSNSQGTASWLDPGRSLTDRVNALLGAMTLPDKVGQMDQQLVTTLTDADGTACGNNGFAMPNPACMQEILIDQNTGSILAGGTENRVDTTGNGGVGNTGYDWANEYNIIHRYAIEHSRLHIPVIFGVDAVHGFGHPWQAPLFPQSIGVGASWDPSVARTGGAVTAAAVRATGWNWVFAPVQDLSRDNRLGADLRDLVRATGSGVRPGRSKRQRAAVGCRPPGIGRRGHREAFRRLLPVDQRARSEPGAVAAELPAERHLAVLCRWYRRRRHDGDGRFRLDQRGPGNGLALPAHRHPARPNGFPGRGDQRLPGRRCAPVGLPRGGGPAGGDREGGERRGRHEHAGLRRRSLAGGRATGRADRRHQPGPDRRGGRAHPDRQGQAGALRSALHAGCQQALRERRRRQRGGDGRPAGRLDGRPGIDHLAAQQQQRAATGAGQQGGGHRPERRLDDEPAGRLERQLAGRVRCRPCLLHGPGQPDPARNDGAARDSVRRPGRGLCTGSIQRPCPDRRKRLRRGGGREGLRRGAGGQPGPGAARGPAGG